MKSLLSCSCAILNMTTLSNEAAKQRLCHPCPYSRRFGCLGGQRIKCLVEFRRDMNLALRVEAPGRDTLVHFHHLYTVQTYRWGDSVPVPAPSWYHWFPAPWMLEHQMPAERWVSVPKPVEQDNKNRNWTGLECVSR